MVKSDRIGTVPIRAVTASFSEPFTEALPLYPPDIKEQKRTAIYLRQIHISVLMFHTVLVNGFKECVINVLFTT